MTGNFYDKVAKKFGEYHTRARYIKECIDEDPEVVFESKLFEVATPEKIALDVGCADGRFTLSIASYFRKIVAIDVSKEMLKSAKNLQQKKRVKNVEFEEQDAKHTTFKDESFDVVYNRRGPSNHKETFRLLKLGGCHLQIDIGEKDCQEIKKVFGRRQGYGQKDESRLKKDVEKLKTIGFDIVYAKEFFYSEFYPTYQDFDLFLQGVPIFEDFDSKKDRKFLEKYVSKYSHKKGIQLQRHRVVTVSKKS